MGGSVRRRADAPGKDHAAVAAAEPASWAKLAKLDTGPIADRAVGRTWCTHGQIKPCWAKEKCFDPATMK